MPARSLPRLLCARPRRWLALFVLALALVAAGLAGATSVSDPYAAAAERIRRAALAGDGAYRKLEVLCDHIGHRLSGSVGLERAVTWAAEAMRTDGLEPVRTEPVMVPHWVRGRESLTLLLPSEEPLPVLGLGGSVGTPPGGVTADVIVVRNDQELEAARDKIPGRIVLFNNVMPPYDPERGSGYGQAVRYRVHGARLAAAHGAVAILIRSVTARSMRTPHTGSTHYGDAPRKIPAAAISTEDADRMARLLARGERVRVRLEMGAHFLPKARSANVVGELRGRSHPDEIVLIGGHLDSWDVGQGAHDDGAGCVIAMESAALLKRLGLRPRRTVRVVLFTNEENGLGGAKQYALDHAGELGRHVAAIEADAGGFAPRGFGVAHVDPERQRRSVAQIERLMRLVAPLGARRTLPGHSGADLIPLKRAGVPSMELLTEGSRYFDYHHTAADTLDKVDPAELRASVAAMAVMTYALAEQPGRLGEGAVAVQPSGTQ